MKLEVGAEWALITNVFPISAGTVDHRQAPGGEHADVAVHFRQDVLQMIFFADLARVGTACCLHQVMDKVIVPARAGARHPNGKYDHSVSSVLKLTPPGAVLEAGSFCVDFNA